MDKINYGIKKKNINRFNQQPAAFFKKLINILVNEFMPISSNF